MKKRTIVKSIVIVLFLIILVGGNTNDKTISGVELEKIAFNSFITSLNNDIGNVAGMEKPERWINYFLRRWEITGASIAIMKNEKLVYAQGFGYADKENSIELEPYHLLRIASISKLVTAVAIMKLIEDDKLHIEDKVFGIDGILNDEKYLNFLDKRVEDITISHLLTHSAGWTTKWGDHLFIPNAIADHLEIDSPVEPSSIIEFALAKKLHYTPGIWSSYTNISYVILGEVIEKVTGDSYEDYVNAAILYPIGIYNMRIGGNLYSEKYLNEVTYYEQSNADSVESIYGTGKIVSHRYGGTDIKTLGSAGGWIATPAELLKLVAAIDATENKFNILEKEAIELMTNKGKKYKPMGWRGSDGNDTWWRTGSLAGTSALLVHLNDSISYCIITNTSSWKGSNFTLELNKLMRKIIHTNDDWPDRDLFVLKKSS